MSAHGGATAPRTLKLLCAGAVKGLVEALQARFLAASGATIEGRFGAVGAMREALLGGAPCDVMIVTAAMLAELRDQGAVADVRSPIGEVRTGVAARSGEAVPRIDSADTLKAALRAAPAIYLPDTVQSTAGRHVVAVLARLGIAAETRRALGATASGGSAHVPRSAAAPRLSSFTSLRRAPHRPDPSRYQRCSIKNGPAADVGRATQRSKGGDGSRRRHRGT